MKLLNLMLVLAASTASDPINAQLLDLNLKNLHSQMQRATAQLEVQRADVVNKLTINQVAPPATPLPGSNGRSSNQDVRSTEVAPLALSKTVAGLTPEQQSALAAAIQTQVAALTLNLNLLLAAEPKTAQINGEIEAINETLTAKKQALALALAAPTPFTNAAAESFAATANPYFLICGSAVWAASDPLKWGEMIAQNKAKILSAGRSVGLIEVGTRPAGTGFVVGNSHVITNLHVVKLIADFEPKAKRWAIRDGVTITFDAEYPLGLETGCPSPNKRRTYLINGVHTHLQDGSDDIAILLTSRDAEYPQKLDVVVKPKTNYAGNMVVAVLGYPGLPSDMTVAEQMQFFRTPDTITPQVVFKRLSGGYTGSDKVTEDGKFVHKANTAGGNSGSPVFDLGDGSIVGIHVEGFDRFSNIMGYNRALTSERIRVLLSRAGLAN